MKGNYALIKVLNNLNLFSNTLESLIIGLYTKIEKEKN
jgi:hypothetical protein